MTEKPATKFLNVNFTQEFIFRELEGKVMRVEFVECDNGDIL